MFQEDDILNIRFFELNTCTESQNVDLGSKYIEIKEMHTALKMVEKAWDISNPQCS